MKNSFGNNVSLTIFGESHGTSIGAVIDGLAPGINVDTEFIGKQLQLRHSLPEISTHRFEKDEFVIESGVFNGKTTGTPLCIIIPNKDFVSSDYDEIKNKARPGHADYTAFCKYNGFADYRGGGHFSGRITAPLVAAGAILISFLNSEGIKIGTHIKKCGTVIDRDFNNYDDDILNLSNSVFPVLCSETSEKMINEIKNVSNKGDSIGGILETAVTGVPAGVGEPWFDSFESMLSHALFSIPSVKGVEFGCGFSCSEMYGSEMNDEFFIKNGQVVTKTNNNGGINGGISNGMPILFKTAIKPVPSINKTQKTVDFVNNTETEITVEGRHDSCIVHRARVVQDSVTALVLCDLLSQKFGANRLGEM